MTQTPEKTTRAERQAATRESLIAHARTMFLTVGYAATSLDRVAEEAGYSKGAVYSNFDGKEELCLAVLDLIHAEKVKRIARIFKGEGDLREKLDTFVAWAEADLADPRWTALEFEFASVAGKNPWVSEQLVRRYREFTTLLSRLVVHISEESGLRGAENAERTATTLLGLGIGLGALKSLDPRVDMSVFGELVATMVKSARGEEPQ